MMREILFRGKRVDNGAWIYGYYAGPVALLDTHEICDISDCVGARSDVDPSTVGQYTGLTDKNGVKIFEGDRVCIPMYRGMADKPVPSTGTVEWRNGAFHVTWDEEMYGRHFVGYLEDVEVIGNIYDDPEPKGR